MPQPMSDLVSSSACAAALRFLISCRKSFGTQHSSSAVSRLPCWETLA